MSAAQGQTTDDRGDVGQPEFEVPTSSATKRLKANFEDSRSKTMILVLVGGILVVGIFMAWLFGGEEESGAASSVAAAQGRAPSIIDDNIELTQARAEVIEREDLDRSQEALATGQSATVRPMGERFDFGILDQIPTQPTEAPAPAPADLAPARAPVVVAPVAQQPDPAEVARLQRQAELAAAKREAMASLMGVMSGAGAPLVFALESQEPVAEEGDPIIANEEFNAIRREVLVQAGTIYYAAMEDTADSDLNNPIFARITNGPLAGTLMRGSFRVSEASRCLVIQFDQITARRQESVAASALGVNPDDGSACLVTERNSRWVQRFGGIVAVGVLGGLGEAARNDGRQTAVTPGGTVVEQSGESDSRRTAGFIAGNIAEESAVIVRENINIAPQVIVAQGTPIGIRFLDDVMAEVGATALATDKR